MPLTLLVRRLPDTPKEVLDACRQLQFRNTTLVYLEIEGEGLFKDNWLYIHSPSLETGRITNFSNWVPEIKGDSPNTILTLEYWSNDGDDFWKKDDTDLIRLAKEEMLATGLLNGRPILRAYVHRIPRCYPVYHKGYKEHLAKVEHYVKGLEGLSVIGRYGAFKYNNQDHSILMGIMTAENLLEAKENDLWGINTDYDNYQESSTITATGLVEQW
jgi:protoporphyrinogen oxidase